MQKRSNWQAPQKLSTLQRHYFGNDRSRNGRKGTKPEDLKKKKSAKRQKATTYCPRSQARRLGSSRDTYISIRHGRSFFHVNIRGSCILFGSNFGLPWLGPSTRIQILYLKKNILHKFYDKTIWNMHSSPTCTQLLIKCQYIIRHYKCLTVGTLPQRYRLSSNQKSL